MVKLRRSTVLDVVAMVGIDSASDGLARAAALDVSVTAAGVDGLLRMRTFDDIEVIFDATSAEAHAENYAKLPYAGNLDIMTCAAVRVGERVVDTSRLPAVAR